MGDALFSKPTSSSKQALNDKELKKIIASEQGSEQFGKQVTLYKPSSSRPDSIDQ